MYTSFYIAENRLNELKDLVRKLKNENEERSNAMNRGNLSDYNHTVKVHIYNNTLEIIKQIEAIIGVV